MSRAAVTPWKRCLVCLSPQTGVRSDCGDGVHGDCGEDDMIIWVVVWCRTVVCE